VANLKVAYLLLLVRCMTETFVVEEIQKIQGEGVEACIDTRHDSRGTPLQPFSKSPILQTRAVPTMALHALQAAQFHLLSNSPGKNFKLLKGRLRELSPGVSFYRKRIACF